MIDKKLLFKAMMDDAFQDLISNDLILDLLESKKYNKSSEFFQLCCYLKDGNIKICGKQIKKLTPKIWCILWILQNKFTTDATQVENKDIDQFLYVLINGLDSLSQLLDAVDFCVKNNIDYEQARLDILNFIQLNFKPLTFLPKQSNTVIAEQPYYGVEWLTRLSAQVASVTNLNATDIAENMSINTCYYYYLYYCADKGVKGIHVQTEDQINKLIFDRTYQLANEYYLANYGDK